MKRLAVLAAFALILAAGGAALLYNVFKPARVATGSVRRGPAVATVFATGSVEARLRRTLRPPRPGIVAEIFAREWAEVKQGAPLLRLRDSARDIRRERAQAELDLVNGNLAEGSAFRTAAAARVAEAKENADQALREVERNRPLLAEGAIQKSVLDELESRARALAERARQASEDVQATLAEWESRRRKGQAELDTILAAEKDDILTAPVDGIVLSLQAEIGESVGPERDLMKVGDIRDLIVESDVDEDDIARVRPGLEVIVRLAGDDEAAAKGEVYEVLPDADRGTKSFKVKVRFREAKFVPDPKSPTGLSGRSELPGGLGLYSGMSAELGIVVARREGALVFPRPALTNRGTVFLVRDGVASEVSVRVGIRSFDACEALEGLQEGDVVAVDGLSRLKTGQRVRAAEAPERGR
ncbi:MAG: HlyD family efflux transporter periplasmic adaptor subunit [Planctomycetes bacterium]|nr:HlyD family efflux transporter periplasmic adaptor subunit [Planctomycetota bacterium]